MSDGDSLETEDLSGESHVARSAYVSNEDLFNAASVRNARAVDDRLRESAPW